MRRKDRGIERLDYAPYTMLLGGLGDVPDDVGINLKKWYLAPRVGTMHRLTENQVVRAGYGRTINPLPWSRPMRGSFPFDITSTTAGMTFGMSARWRRVSRRPGPGHQLGPGQAAAGHLRALAQSGSGRPRHDSAVERRLRVPLAVGRRDRVRVCRHGHRRRLRRPEHQLRRAGRRQRARQYFGVAGTTAINDWASRTKSRYHGLQIAINRPFTTACC